jgi:alpha-beta hydrolase superfamily lysophospholipase
MTHRLGSVFALVLTLSQSTTETRADAGQFAIEEVAFRSVDAVIAGTVISPPKIRAAIVVVHGAGRETRMLAFARDLAAHGIAVLTYDKRGVARSGGTYVGPEVGTNNVDKANLQLLAEDAAVAARELARNLPSRDVPVGLMGFSLAGWVIPLAARMNPDVRFMILQSGPVVSTHEQVRFQDLTKEQPDFWEHHTEDEARKRMAGPDRLSFVDTDPRDALQHLSIPGLWLYGGRDVVVPVKLSIQRLKSLAAEGKPFEYQVFPDSGHRLREADALPAMLDWLNRTTAKPRPR